MSEQDRLDRLLGIRQVETMTGRNRMTLYRWWQNDKFPRPTLIQERNMWRLSSIEKWMEKQIPVGAKSK